MTLIIATMHTEHFEFMAVAETKSSARELIGKAFRRHIRQYRLSTVWPRSNTDLIAELKDYYGINLYEAGGSGTAWRDGSVLIGGTP